MLEPTGEVPDTMPSNSKRKRSVAEGKGDDQDDSVQHPPPKRSKKQYDAQVACQDLYESVRLYKNENGELCCEAMIRVPKRRAAPDYYEVVDQPIDLLKIQQKLKMEEYEDLEQISSDIELMINNARKYYKKNTKEYRLANELWDVYAEAKSDIISEALGETTRAERIARRKRAYVVDKSEDEDEDDDQTDPSAEMRGEDSQEGSLESGSDMKTDSKPDDPDDLESLFAAIMTARDGDRDISEMFQLLPSKSKYPEYYTVIKEPIDLKSIAQKIQDNVYRTLEELERDLNLMIKNAKTFNEPKSQIFRDACSLRKIVATKKQELEYKKTGVLKSSERIRTRERSNVQRLSAVCAALQYQSDDEEMTVMEEGESEGEVTMTEEQTPQWALYNCIIEFRGPHGEVLADPFLRLPSRRTYPDYYEEIKRPMSVYNIRKKIRMNQYSSVAEVAADMTLVFENAKRYNRESSPIYKWAVILQKLMAEKKKELERFEGKEMFVEEASPFTLPSKVKVEREEEEVSIAKSKPRRSQGTGEGEKKKSHKKSTPEELLKRRLLTLYKTVHDYTNSSGRALREIFMTLPSKKDYPDYYQVITEPIDMTMIEAKIKSDKYTNEFGMLSDFELMFNNARHYNEEGSQVYQDADTLDRILRTRWRHMSATMAAKAGGGKNKPKAKQNASPLAQKLQDLFETIRDYTDKAGRVLSTPFIKLPLKNEYPDYYEVIKRPIDMQRIQQKLVGGQYESVEDMVADFVLMFDNACKYNEPDSLIYKDSLTLQRICLEKKMELSSDGSNDVPDVRALVQELMTNLFISTYNFQDEEGRCFSDSFNELPDADPNTQDAEKPLKFDQIKRNLDKGRYRRVDKFQEDMFQVFERARKQSRIDSQLYEDAVEIQTFFLKIRDELCKNGELLVTPALSYTERMLQSALESEKREKLPLEGGEEGAEKKKAGEGEIKMEEGVAADEVKEDSVRFQDQSYSVGDFVYVEPRREAADPQGDSVSAVAKREPRLEPHILLIEKFVKDSSGQQLIQGNWFYRPNETFHLATRKFLEKEVFKSDLVTTIPMGQIIGRCHVMFVKDYFKNRPEAIPDKDVYVCESRYSQKHKCFKKIKIWQVPANENTKIVPRDIPLVPVRVASVFADKEPGEAIEEDDGETSIIDKRREEVILTEPTPEDPNTYYEQKLTNIGSIKLGDCVYVRGEKGNSLIARIDKIWTTPEGDAYFYGPWFVRPAEIPHSPTRLFYKREVFLSSIEDTNPMQSIIGKCAVLHIKDYCACRPTEIPEHDVYICESKYHEGERSIKRLGKGLKKYSLSPKVTDDEVYFFRKPIVPQKEPSPLLLKASEEGLGAEIEDSMISEADTVTDSLGTSIDEAATPQPEKPQKKSKKESARRQPSGYIVFAGEIRKQIQNENPDCSFGDISRIVGTKWRNLNKEEKDHFEEKAKRIAAEQEAKQQEAEKAFNESLNRSQSPWSDYGAMSPNPGGRPNTPGSYPGGAGAYGATPQYSGYQPYQGFPGQSPVPPGMYGGPQRGIPSSMYQGPASPRAGQPMGSGYPPGMTPPNPSMTPSPLPGPYPLPPHSPQAGMPPGSMAGQGSGQQMAPPPVPTRPPSPIFVPVPPRSQRLLHSEAYLRYIEGLNTENRSVGDWQKTLSAAPENTPPVPDHRLPSHWMAQGPGYHGNVSNALWALRDLMLKDTLSIVRTIPFDDL